MSRTYREFGDLLSAYNEADEKWTPIQKAHEFLDSVNEDEIWEQRHAAADALFTYIAELEAERRWRVVADGELPELGKEVIFYDSKMEGLLKGCLRKNGGAEWLSDEGYTFSSRDGRYSRITHWMYAPQPPEVQE